LQITTDAPSTERTNVTARERFQEQREIVQTVIRSYNITRQQSIVVASNPDPQPTSTALRWTPIGAHFVADVESTLRKTLQGKPDEAELREAWQRLLDETAVIRKAEQRLIQILAVAFRRNGLEPRLYFKPNKYPRRRAA
jgi:hypothetical protein